MFCINNLGLAGSVVLPNGFIYVIAGWTGSSSNTILVYDTVNDDVYTSSYTYPLTTNGVSCGYYPTKGYIYCIGGSGNDNLIRSNDLGNVSAPDSTNPTLEPTTNPSINPTSNPTTNPSDVPSDMPTMNPTINPVTGDPSSTPSEYPTGAPYIGQTSEPTPILHVQMLWIHGLI